MANLAKGFNVGDDGLIFGEDSVTGILSGTTDPSTGSGQAAPIGSLFLFTGGSLFIKTGSADTAWTAIEATVLAGLGLYYTGGNTLNVATANASRIVVGSSVDLALTGISGGTYTKLTVDSYGRAVIGGYITSQDVTDALGFVPIPDNGALDALVSTNTTGIYIITGTGTSATRSIVVPPGMTITNADGVLGNPTIALDDELAALEAFTAVGLAAHTAHDVWEARTIISSTDGIVVTNGNGINGDPTLDLGADLAAIEALSTFGFAVRESESMWTTVSLAGTTNQINISNPDGTTGTPTFSLAPNTIIPGTGALTLPIGNTTQQPATPVAGMIRYNELTSKYEGYDTSWFNFATETWADDTFQPLNTNLTALSNTSTVGLYVVTGSGTSAVRAIISTGGTLSVTNGTGFAGDISLDISPTYIGQGSITTLGTVTTGAWNSSPIEVPYGGTGLTSLGSAYQVLGVNAAGNALEYQTVAAGTAIGITNATGLLTISNTGPTSILAGTGISVSNPTGPVTINNTGVLSVTSTSQSVLVSGSQNIVISGPKLYAENPQSGLVPPSAAGANAVALGSGAIATADNSLALGEQAVTRIQGGVVQASGRFASSGDAQTGRYTVRANTVSTFPSEGFVDGQGGSVRLVLADNSTWTFRIMVAAQRTDVNDGRAGFQLKGVIYRVAGAASVALQGGITVEQFSASNPWSVLVDADTTNGSLRIQFVGENGKVIRWVALIETVEVTD